MNNPHNRKKRRPARWVLALSGLLGLLLLGWLAVPYLININNYRAQIVSQLEERLGRQVSLGALSLKVWPRLRVNVDDVQINDDPQFAAAAFVQAKAVRLQLGWWSLLRGQPQVQGLELDEPAVTLIKTAPEQWNWRTLKAVQGTAPEAEQTPLELLISNGSFTLRDRSLTPPVEQTFSGVQARLTDFAPRRAFAFELALTVPGAQAGQLQLSGTAGPLNAQEPARTPLQARVKMAQVEIASLAALLGGQYASAGKLTLEADLAGTFAEELKAAGQLKAEQWRLVEGVEPARLPLAATFQLVARAAKNAAGEREYAVQVEQGELALGKTAARLTGQVTQLPAQPAYDLQVQGDGIALDDLLESAYALGFGPPAGTKASGAASLNLRASGTGQHVVLQGQASVRGLQFQSAQLPQAMQVSELHLSCTPQAITAAPFRSTLSQTAVDFKGLTISNYSQPDKAPRARVEIATSNAQISDLLQIAEAFGARPDLRGSGAASLSAALETNLGQGSRALQINGQGQVSGASLQPAQLKKPLELAHADLTFTGDSARLDNMQARLGASQAAGWIHVKSFAQSLVAFALKANQINVAELQQALNESGAASSAQQSSTSAWRAEGQLSVGKLQLETLTATDVQSNVTLLNQVMTFAPVSLKAFGGSYEGGLRVDQAQNPPEVALNGRFHGVDINQLLSSAGERSMIYGQAAGSVDMRGRGRAGEQLAQSLVGGGAITISDGKFTSFDLLKQVEVLGKFVNLPTGGAGTAFRSLKTNLKFAQGRLTMDALQLVMDDVQVSGDGALQLGAAPTINYDLLVRLSQALTKRLLAGAAANSATDSGSLPLKLPAGLAAAAGNFFVEQDAMVLPLKVSGPLQQPSFGLNTALLQKRAAAQLKASLKEQIRKKLEPAQPKDEKAEQSEPDKDKSTLKKSVDILKGVFDKFRKKEKQ